MRKQAGFTLIELIMVIVILGILAATALPRFAALQGEARAASRNGVAGGVRAAAAIAHAQALLDTDGTITLEGQNVTIVNGYPTADAAGIGAAAVIDGVTATYATGPNLVTWTIASDCTVTYAEAPANGAPTIAGTATCAD